MVTAQRDAAAAMVAASTMAESPFSAPNGALSRPTPLSTPALISSCLFSAAESQGRGIGAEGIGIGQGSLGSEGCCQTEREELVREG